MTIPVVDITKASSSSASCHGDSFEDDEGINLPDDLAAQRHAMGVIHELQKAHETNWRGFKMEVRRDGQLLWEIPFESVVPSG